MSKEEITKEHHHQGSVNASDQEFANWLNRLWARKEPPERLELWQTQGRVRGEMIYHEDFHPGEKVDPEKVNKISNEILEAAQNDCDAREKPKPRTYQVAVIDRNRKAMPLIRSIGPIFPQRSYALTKSEHHEGETDDEDLDAKKLDLRYVHMGMDQARWDKNRYDQVLGELLVLYHHTVQDLRVWNEKLMHQNIQFQERTQDLLDRSQDRELIRDKERFKMSMWEDGKRTILNLLPGLAANAMGGQPAALPANGAPVAVDQQQHAKSPESALVDNFLHDCDKANLSMALFGEFEEINEQIVLVKPGIFSVGQYKILLGVREGRMPTAALDQLMPQSGHKNEVTGEQLAKAQQAGVTEGMSLGLFEIISMRNQAKAKAAEATAAQPEQEKEIRP